MKNNALITNDLSVVGTCVDDNYDGHGDLHTSLFSSADNILICEPSRVRDLSDGKSFRKSESKARRIGANLLVNFSLEKSEVSVAVKYKKRFKYLNSNQLASLIIYTDLFLKRGQGEFSDKSIVTTSVTTKLIEKMTKGTGVSVIEELPDEDMFMRGIDSSRESGGLLLGFDENSKFFFGADKNPVREVIKTFKFLDRNNLNPYEVIKEINDKFGIHRTYSYEKDLKKSSSKKLIKSLKKHMKIGVNKIDSIETVELSRKKLVSVTFKNSSTIKMVSDKRSDKTKIFIENVGQPNSDINRIITFEKEVENYINDNTEIIEDKKFSWKTVIKYSLFIIILAGTIALVFNVIYSDISGTGKVGLSETFSAASSIWHLENAWPWLILWIWKVATMFISAWSKKRMFMIMNESVKVKHLVISAIMGGIVAFITPFTIGGDAIGYWYLRRKGVKRAPLIAALSSSTLIGEAKFTIQTVFLVAIGWPIYQEVFNGSIESQAALIWFFCGLSWSIFATTMIFIVTLSRRFQNFVITKGIKFLEWFRFTHIYDPWRKTSELRYEFFMMRSGMKRIWTTWYFPFELIFYAMIPLFFQPTTIVYAYSGIIKGNLGVNPYFAIIVCNDIIGTANSMSFLPGGSGTGEWLARSINSVIHTHNTAALPYSAETVANGNDLFWKLISTWPWLVISAVLTIFTVIIESSRKHKKTLKIVLFSVIMLFSLTLLIVYFMLY